MFLCFYVFMFLTKSLFSSHHIIRSHRENVLIATKYALSHDLKNNEAGKGSLIFKISRAYRKQIKKSNASEGLVATELSNAPSDGAKQCS